MSKKRERTRETIIAISYTLFAKSGFKQITMKDICDATGMSRGGLYSHFSSTKEIFEAILEKLSQKEELNFYSEMEKNTSAVEILNGAFALLEEEMNDSEASLGLAIYEYSDCVDNNLMQRYNQIGVQKWTELLQYGIARGEFHKVDVRGMVNIILYAYQGVRMWSRVIPMEPDTFQSITSLIKRQLGGKDNGTDNKKINTTSLEGK